MYTELDLWNYIYITVIWVEKNQNRYFYMHILNVALASVQ